MIWRGRRGQSLICTSGYGRSWLYLLITKTSIPFTIKISLLHPELKRLIFYSLNFIVLRAIALNTAFLIFAVKGSHLL